MKAHEKLLTRLHTDYPNKFKFQFLTLTVKNCKGSELRDTIKQMTTAFNKMSRYKAFDTIVKGYIRRVEVTYNDKRDDYHPHIHALLVVPSQYKPSKKEYVNQKEWRDLWAKAMKLDYDPNVDIRLVRNKRKIDEDNTTNGTNKMLVPGFAAVQEISKYQVKPIEVDENLSDLLRSKIYGTLHEALKGVRAVTYGGILKELALKIL
ncbi:protein rep, partial [Streptococcus pluranimalium]|uniref:protein rep n=1 Tax=Streptococcus pluranimalium TaxID=82348 RepID=UPI003F68C47F